MVQQQEPLTVRPMTAREFDDWRAASAAGYAQDKVTAGQWSPEEAQGLAEQEFDELLPDGLDTAGMQLLVGEVDGQAVGRVWIGPRGSGPSDRAWIWDIEVEAAQQGRGFGRALLALAEQAARDAGFRRIGLNVFGANAVARSLYDSSGYRVDTQQMSKALT